VLDFGLARRLPSRLETAESHTTLTEEGAVVGTPRYMAPEQIDGQAADERSDIFAFGLVLYEMLTGRHAFEGKSAASVMAGILEREPAPISALVPSLPPALEQVVMTCLAKDPAERWQSVRELKHALAWAAGAGSRHGGDRWSREAVAGGAIALLAIAIGSAVVLRRPSAPRLRPVRFEVALPENAEPDVLSPAAVSPDGERIALSLTLAGDPRPKVFIRALDSVALTPLPGGEDGTGPFWSPDGKELAFFAMPGVLKKVRVSGGAPVTLCRTPGAQGATWGREGTILLSTAGRLFRVPASGGDVTAAAPLVEGETGRYWPLFLPDGRHYLYLSLNRGREDDGVYAGALGSDLRKRIVATAHNAAYASGHLLFMRDDALMAQPFDPDRLELSGQAFTVLEQVTRLSGNTTAGIAHFSVSTDGVLAWRAGSPAEPRQLTWFDRSGKLLGKLGEPALQYALALSPDERSVAVCRAESATNRDIWVLDVASGASRRLTFDPHDDCGPTWSPDGKRIAFFSDRRGVREIYQKSADGSSEDELLVASLDFPLHLEDWSADGRFLVLNSPRPRTRLDLFLVSLEPPGARKPIPFLDTEALEHRGHISPNGRWIVYCSSASDRPEIYVRDLTAQGRPGPGTWQISNAGGWVTRWRRDGKEILYATDAPGSRIVSVAVRPTGPTFEPGPPTPLGVTVGVPGDFFDVTRDGQRLLVPVPIKAHEPIRVLVNWLR
jgi:Tol biopolymer transport system component